MTKRTIDMIIRIGIEIVEWVSFILKEKRKDKGNDGKGNSEKKQKGGTAQGNPSGS